MGKRPKKQLKESMRRSSISSSYKKELAALTCANPEKEELYSYYKRGMLSCESDILEARETGNAALLKQAKKDMDYIKQEYSDKPEFAKRYEKEHELEYGLLMNAALNQLSDGNKEKYDELFKEAQNIGAFIDPPKRLLACHQRISEERRGLLIDSIGDKLLETKRAPAPHELRLYTSGGR